MPSQKSTAVGAEGELAELQRLLDLITVCPSKQQLPTIGITGDGDSTPRGRHSGSHHQSTEAYALEQFSTRYGDQRNFHQTKHSKIFSDIFTALIRHRLCQDDWSERAPPENIQRVLGVMRLLMRDQKFQKTFISKQEGLVKLCAALDRATQSYLQQGETPYIVDILTELTNIIQKLSSCSDEHCKLIVDNGAHKALVMLLSASNATLLHCTLYALRCLAQSERPRSLIGELNCIEKIMHILEDYDVDSKRLAAHLLKILCGDSQVREMIKVYDGIPLLLRLLNGCDLKLLRNVVWCLVQLAEDQDTSNELRYMGVIPLLIKCLQEKSYSNPSTMTAPASATLGGRTYHSVSSEDSSCTDEMIEQVFMLKTACCAALTQLVKNDHGSQQIVSNNGVYAVGMLILPEGTHCKAKETLQKNALRTLRFLFSMERNRRMFRRIFQSATAVFGAFIDVGHYVHAIDKYQGVVDLLNSLPETSLEQLGENIASSNTNREVTQYIEDYDVMEHLGSGAFGSVYKVRKRKSNQAFYALKEVNLNQASLGKAAKEKDKSIGEMISEINIVREQMKHPNIVKYYRTFVLDNTKLYIVMELIDGAPLGEHFTSLKEKGQTFTEDRIWNIFIQIVLALRYLHKEKKIVHRDLSPNNIMLGENDKVKITDFGLAKAKQKQSDMRSVVGTILYSCPEIVQSLPYGENADVWAIGCILYQMGALVPPFSTSNMLALAKHIVDGQYKPLPEGVYSQKISDTVAKCLTVDPKERPDIIGVTAFIAEEFVEYTERLRSVNTSMERKLEKERRRTQRHHSKANNYMQDYQRLFIASQEKYDRLANLQASGSSVQLTADFADENNNMDKGWMSVEDEEEPSSSDSSGSASSLRLGFTRPKPPSAPRRKRLDFKLDPLAVEIPDRKQGARDSGFSSAGEPSPNDALHSKIMTTSAKHDYNRSFSSPNMEVKRQYSTSSTKPRPGSGGTTATLSISPRKVRQINDPIQQMLITLHKIIWISQLAPSLEHNPRRSCIEKFKRALFSMNSNSAHLKTELKKIASGSPDLVDIHLGGVDLNGAMGQDRNGEQEGLVDTEDGNHITYEQMQTIIETVLKESGYYSMPSSSKQQRQQFPLGPINHTRRVR